MQTIPGPPAQSSLETAARHLQALRVLLRRDYLGRPDWDYALLDLAEMAKQALQAQETYVALFDSETGRWTAIVSGGKRLTAEGISARGSTSVLERVRETGKPVLSTSAQPLDFSSESIRAHDVASVLAAPLFFWNADQAQLRLGGCIYAHRTLEAQPFDQADVDLLLDITGIAQPTLNLLRDLKAVRADLETSRQHLQQLLEATATRFRLGRYETSDPWFAEHVLGTLQSVAQADKVGLLILGPTGSGKSYLAQAYHYECPRKDGPFVVLDCSQATSEQTLAAELFGYAPRSGFANAPPSGRAGAAELADRGTLFIDEIGTLPRELQQKLLTLIQTGTYSPLGSSERKQVDLQVIAATNEDIEHAVEEKRFREDLFWRISMVTIRLPPLSQRPSDVPKLAEAFLEAARKQFAKRDVEGFKPQAMDALVGFDWSRAGNLRGLEQTVYRSVLLAPPGTRKLEAGHLKLQSLAASPARPERRSKRTEPKAPRQPAMDQADLPSLEAMKAAIQQERYSTAAAKALGISHNSLIWALRKAGLTIRDVLAQGG